MNQMHTIPYALPFYNRYRTGSHAYANLAYLSQIVIKVTFPTPGTGFSRKGQPFKPATIAHVYISKGFTL